MARDEKRSRDADSREARGNTADGARQASEMEREGMDLLGRSSVRDGALEGVSDAPARADQHAEGPATGSGTGPRRNPPENPAAGTGDGGIGASGGVAGGARGHGGRSDAMESSETGGRPAQFKGTSRFDYDHGTVDETGGGERDRGAGPGEGR